MIRYLDKKRSSFGYRAISFLIAFTFILSLVVPPQSAYAQMAINLPTPGVMVPLSSGFTPALIRGVTIHPDNPLKFNFIVDNGDSDLEAEAFEKESQKLIKYFLASLTIPEKDLWVNLSPYEKNRIITEEFGKTDMGRDLLAQDYILKQLTASLMYPEDDLGKKFWDRVYKRAYELYGTTEIPINTFNKVWIVPDKAVIYESGNTAFVAESHLKVMLEEDYLSLENNMYSRERGMDELKEEDAKDISNVSSQVVREVLIPEIEKEVNEGKNFANLRQITYALILATWYKKALKESLLGKIYVDQGKVKGVDSKDPQAKQKIYEQYIEAFKKGVYNFIKEDYDPATQQMLPRKYFSGGFSLQNPIIDVRTGQPMRDAATGQIMTEDFAMTVQVATTPQELRAKGAWDGVQQIGEVARLGRIHNIEVALEEFGTSPVMAQFQDNAMVSQSIQQKIETISAGQVDRRIDPTGKYSQGVTIGAAKMIEFKSGTLGDFLFDLNAKTIGGKALELALSKSSFEGNADQIRKDYDLAMQELRKDSKTDQLTAPQLGRVVYSVVEGLTGDSDPHSELDAQTVAAFERIYPELKQKVGLNALETEVSRGESTDRWKDVLFGSFVMGALSSATDTTFFGSKKAVTPIANDLGVEADDLHFRDEAELMGLALQALGDPVTSDKIKGRENFDQWVAELESKKDQPVIIRTDDKEDFIVIQLKIETLLLAGFNVVVAGAQAPVMNDATAGWIQSKLETHPDFKKYLDSDQLKVISTGNAIGGTDLNNTSAEFNQAFLSASSIVAEGSTNAESLVTPKGVAGLPTSVIFSTMSGKQGVEVDFQFKSGVPRADLGTDDAMTAKVSAQDLNYEPAQGDQDDPLGIHPGVLKIGGEQTKILGYGTEADVFVVPGSARAVRVHHDALRLQERREVRKRFPVWRRLGERGIIPQVWDHGYTSNDSQEGRLFVEMDRLKVSLLVNDVLARENVFLTDAEVDQVIGMVGELVEEGILVDDFKIENVMRGRRPGEAPDRSRLYLTDFYSAHSYPGRDLVGIYRSILTDTNTGWASFTTPQQMQRITTALELMRPRGEVQEEDFAMVAGTMLNEPVAANVPKQMSLPAEIILAPGLSSTHLRAQSVKDLSSAERDLIKSKFGKNVQAVVYDPRKPFRFFPVHEGVSLVIGSKNLSKILLEPNEFVSRRHVQVETDGDTILVTDLDSQNGTSVEHYAEYSTVSDEVVESNMNKINSHQFEILSEIKSDRTVEKGGYVSVGGVFDREGNIVEWGDAQELRGRIEGFDEKLDRGELFQFVVQKEVDNLYEEMDRPLYALERVGSEFKQTVPPDTAIQRVVSAVASLDENVRKKVRESADLTANERRYIAALVTVMNEGDTAKALKMLRPGLFLTKRAPRVTPAMARNYQAAKRRYVNLRRRMDASFPGSSGFREIRKELAADPYSLAKRKLKNVLRDSGIHWDLTLELTYFPGVANSIKERRALYAIDDLAKQTRQPQGAEDSAMVATDAGRQRSPMSTERLAAIMPFIIHEAGNFFNPVIVVLETMNEDYLDTAQQEVLGTMLAEANGVASQIYRVQNAAQDGTMSSADKVAVLEKLRSQLIALQTRINKAIMPESPLASSDDLEKVKDATDRTLQFLVSRLSGENDIKAEKFDLRDVVQRSVTSVSSRFMAAVAAGDLVIDVDFESGKNPIEMYADPLHVRQVVTNLVKNAAEALPEQKGKIKVKVVFSEEGDEVTISIADNGTGMSAETRKKIFDPFFTTKGEAGTGVGLYISNDLVAAHGGQITVDSREGQGTTFHVFLPTDISSTFLEDGERRKKGVGQPDTDWGEDDEILVREIRALRKRLNRIPNVVSVEERNLGRGEHGHKPNPERLKILGEIDAAREQLARKFERWTWEGASSPASTDDAMTARSSRFATPKGADKKGGIDLNPINMNLQIKRDGNGVPLPLESQELRNINIQGFTPVIINITPMNNLPLILGASQEEPEPLAFLAR